MKVRLKIPATTANLGPGFDCLGCALSMYTYIELESADGVFEILGCDEKYAGRDNLVYTSYLKALEYMGKKDTGVRITIQTDVPVARGFGSSAAMIVGGVVGANVLNGSPLSAKELFKICNDIEGHPDNIAPALFGGLTASMVSNGTPLTVGYGVHEDFYFCALVPDFETKTSDARSVLPDSVSREDAVYNVSHTALMLKALETGNDVLMRHAMSDRLHEPYRKHLIHGFDVVRALALSNGACSFCISGAGSTCMCITKDENFGNVMAEKIKDFPNNWQVIMLRPSENGVEVLDVE